MKSAISPARHLISALGLLVLLVFLLAQASAATATGAMSSQEKSAAAKRLALKKAQQLRDTAMRSIDAGNDSEALDLFQQQLEILRPLLTPGDPMITLTVFDMALLYQRKPNSDKIGELLQRELASLEQAFGPGSAQADEFLNFAGSGGFLKYLERYYFLKKDYEKAEPLCLREVAILEKASDVQPLDLIDALDRIAQLYSAKGDYAKAEPLFERLVALDKSEWSDLQVHLANLYVEQKEYAKAEELYRRALKREEAHLEKKPSDPDISRHIDLAIVTIVGKLGILYVRTADYAKAAPMFKRALEKGDKYLGPEETFLYLKLLGLSYLNQGDLLRAEGILRGTLKMAEMASDSNNPEAADIMRNLARLYREKGDYPGAEQMNQQAIAIYEKAGLQNTSEFAVMLNDLALLDLARGAYDQAEQSTRRALAILEKAGKPDEAVFAASFNNLGMIYQTRGEYAKAEPLFERAIARMEKSSSIRSAEFATTLNNLGQIYSEKGDYEKAASLLRRALAIDERIFGANHVKTAIDLNNLGNLLMRLGGGAEASPFFERALAAYEQAFGPDHPEVATLLNNLALAYVYKSKDEIPKAEKLYQRAIAIQEKALGPNHPGLTVALNNLAMIYLKAGEYAKAESSFQRALTILEKAALPYSPNAAQILENLATLYEIKGDVTRALEVNSRSNEALERNLALNLTTGSEKQKLLYLASIVDKTYATISLHIQSAPKDQTALRLALTTILRRKGRALDAMADTFSALRHRLNPQDRELLDQLAAARARLAALVLAGTDNNDPEKLRADIKRLEEQIEKLESDASRRSTEFRAQSQPVTIEAVQTAIPPDAALIEFFVFQPSNAKTTRLFGSPRYAAYVLRHSGEPAYVDLGEAKPVDEAVQALRAVLRKDGDQPLGDVDRAVKPIARALDEKVMQPVRALIGDARRLLVSPDGALNLIPFAALVDEKNRFLVESYAISYLTSGRDLLRLQTRIASNQGPVVFAAPDFGEGGAAQSERGLKVAKEAGEAKATSQTSGQADHHALSFSDVYFTPLPGTEEEASKLKTILPEAVMLMKSSATETALKQVAGPSLLHVATHGFFLEDVVMGPGANASRGLIVKGKQAGEVAAASVRIENPLLRSGLGLAGANLKKSGSDDGILTALEAAGLNLWGTKLVVLSACDTGVGEVRNGEGVAGLRRALVLAGSEAQVMSLWPVSDEGTRDLMIAYYAGLKAGQGRSEALRQVQLRMLTSKERQHPYFWASFIQSGEWANLDGKR